MISVVASNGLRHMLGAPFSAVHHLSHDIDGGCHDVALGMGCSHALWL